MAAIGQSLMKEASSASNYQSYPSPLAEYADVVANPRLFMNTLEKLHSAMGTKFMIPIIGGKELDLHRLFVEVTSRGGIEKIIKERRWKDVTAVFNFPSTATNASFVLRKYYVSLLHHYEQIYYFRSRGGPPSTCTGYLRNPSIATVSAPSRDTFHYAEVSKPSVIQQPGVSSVELPQGPSQAWPAGSPVTGVIDGKFESGYLVTVLIGSEKLKGVLYQTPQCASQKMHQTGTSAIRNITPVASGVHRRRRRKKCEIKRRDPSHPKPNRSGYNFFFAEQHARLKPLHPGKDREISRMIGELWNKLTESERAVYQEKAVKDKERYKTEMENYRQRLRSGEIISDAVPLQQRLPEHDVDMGESDMKMDENEEGDSLGTLDNDSNDDDKGDTEDDTDADMEESPCAAGSAVVAESNNLDLDTPATMEAVERQKIAVEPPIEEQREKVAVDIAMDIGNDEEAVETQTKEVGDAFENVANGKNEETIAKPVESVEEPLPQPES